MKICVLIFTGLLFTTIAPAQVFDNVTYYKKYSPTELREDLDFLLKKFESIHPNYFSETPKDSVIKRYNLLKGQIVKPMTRIDFMNLFSPMVYGVIKDGHNYVNGPDEDVKLYVDRGGKFFPFPIKIDHGKLFVNSKKSEIPYNAQIITINSLPSTEIVKKVLGSYNPENNDFKERFLSEDFSKLYWFCYGGVNQFEISYVDVLDNTTKKLTIAAKSTIEIDKLRSGITQNKNYVLKNSNYAFYELPEINAGVLDFKVCDDLEHFRAFCNDVFTLLQTKHYSNFIIDIRNNGGGTTRLNKILYEYLTNQPITEYSEIDTKVSKDGKQDFIEANRKYAGWFKWYNYLYYPIYIRLNSSRRKALTAKNETFTTQTFSPVKPDENKLRFNGNTYLLTSAATYSSAAIFAAAFKCYHIGTIVGQETGEPTCFTGDWVGVTLPHTKLECAISNKRYILACGKCDTHGVMPDYVVDNSYPDNPLIDPELDRIKSIIKAKNKER